jgi:hypothetical protein
MKDGARSCKVRGSWMMSILEGIEVVTLLSTDLWLIRFRFCFRSPMLSACYIAWTVRTIYLI